MIRKKISEIITEKINGEWGQDASGDAGVKVLRTTNFTQYGKIDYSDIVYRKISDSVIQRKKLLSGDIIIEKSGGSTNRPVGRVVLFDKEDEIILNNNFTTALRPDQSKISPLYLYFHLRYFHHVGKTLKYQTKTTGILNLKLDDYLSETILLPSIPDQIRIATLLSRIEALTAKRRDSLLLLDDLARSRFWEMFGDPATNSKGLPLRKLSEFYITPKSGIKTGPFGSLLKREEYEGNGVPVWTMDNITKKGEFDKTKCLFIPESKFLSLIPYSVKDGDILISRAGTVGKMCVVRGIGDKSIISTNLIRLRLNNDLTPEFFVSLMTHFKTRVARLKVGADDTFSHMNEAILDEIKFPYPDPKDQSGFVNFQDKVFNIKSKYTDSLTTLEHLYASASHRAFQGELDLSVMDVREELLRHEMAATQIAPSVQESLKSVGKRVSHLYRQMTDAAKPLFQFVEAQSKIGTAMAALRPALEILQQFRPLQKQSLAHFKAIGPSVVAYQKIQKEWAQSAEQWANRSYTFEEFWEEEITAENYEARKVEMYQWLRGGFLTQEFDTEKRSVVFKMRQSQTQPNE